MRTTTAFGAAVIAAAATYLFDPDVGRRRRAVLREKVAGRLSNADDAARVGAIDLRNRSKGVLGALRTRIMSRQVPDEVLAERVMAKVGRAASHPGAIEVIARERTVTLRGPVLKQEHDRIVRTTRTVPGVRDVIDELEEHKQQGNVSALQGGRRRLQRMDIMQEHWAPATRVLVGGAGITLVGCALLQRSPLSIALSLAGAAMALRAGANMSLPRLLGQRGPYIDYIKTIHIAAPVEEVFDFWRNFENFPRFMRNVRSVRRNAEENWHWEVAGPFGATVQWDADMTVCIPNELIAWSTTPGSQVQHAGLVHFQREGEGTRVQVEMGYNPPGAMLGHAVALLFGPDPLTEMDEDLMRMKVFLETGKPARDAAQASLEPPAQAKL